MATCQRHLRIPAHAWPVRKWRLIKRNVPLADLVLSSKVESPVADVQDRAIVIIKQNFPISPNDGHVELVVGDEDLQLVLLLLLNLDGKLGPVVGIVGKETKLVT